MSDPLISVDRTTPGIARLSWPDDTDPAHVAAALRRVADQLTADLGAGGQDVHRLEIALVGADPLLRRAVVRAGFRSEGVQRAAHELADGTYADVSLFARLATDAATGPAGWSGVMNSLMPRKRLIAHVLIRDAAERVLLCETTFKPDWELPGGIVEPLETPRAGAAREIMEELGVDHPIGPPLVCDWMPPYLGWEDAVELIFDGGRIDEPALGALVLDPREIRAVRLVTLAEAETLLTPLAFRRLSVAASLPAGAFAYTEDGRRVG